MLATPELIAQPGLPVELCRLLPRYLTKYPLYSSRSARDFAQLPLITKHDIRAGFPANFLGEDANLDELLDKGLIELEHTSGTSEQRTPLLLERGWWTRQERKALRLNAFIAGVLDQHPDAQRVVISSPNCSSEICYTSVPSRDDRIIGNSLYVSLSRFPFLWGSGDLKRIASETLEWEPLFLDVDPVYGVRFALYCEEQGIRIPSLRFLLASYEFVSGVHRRILERVFKVPVFNLYGSTETGHLLMEDEDGRMLPSRETAFFEVINTDPNNVGDLIVTTLTNDYMPLVRYRIGDLVEARVGPHLSDYVLHGRHLDAFRGRSGVRVTTLQIDRHLDDVSGIVHYQLREQSDATVTLFYLPEKTAPSATALNRLSRELTDLLGVEQLVRCVPVDLLMPESSGKFRLGCPISEVEP